jgi:uncharacterized lipoprotein NlpE involved in copper resistance
MKSKILSIAMLTALFLNSCKETTKQEGAEAKETVAVSKKEVFGTYEGTSAGANSLIKEKLTLHSDKTFTKTMVYVDKGNKEFVDIGTFKIDNGKVILDVEHDKEGGFYKIFDDYLLQLDVMGNEITTDKAEMYKMKKINH